MADEARIRAELDFRGAESVQALSQRIDEMKQRGTEAAESLSRNEITTEQYAATVKEIAPQLRALESAYKVLTAGQREAAESGDQLADTFGEELDAARAYEQQLRQVAEATRAAEQAGEDLNAPLREHAIAEARAELQWLQTTGHEVAESFAQGAISEEVFAQDMKLLADESAEVRARLAALDAEKRAEAAEKAATAKRSGAKATKDVSDAADKGKSKVASFGQSMLQAGRSVQDIQAAGLRGILNNLEGLTIALGGSAGLTGAITLAAVAFETLKPQIKAAWEALSPEGPRQAASEIERLSKRIEELKEQHVTLVVDRKELDRAEAQLKRLKEAQDEYRRARGQQTSDEAEAGRAASEAIAEEGEPGISSAIKAKYIREQAAQSQAIREAREAQQRAKAISEHTERALPSAGSPEAQEALFQTIAMQEKALVRAQERERAGTAAIQQNAETFYGALRKDLREGAGEKQSAAREQFARQLEGIGRGGLATQIRGTTPENLTYQHQIDEELERSIQDLKDTRQRNKDVLRKRDESAKQAIDDYVGSNEAEKRVMALTAEPENEGLDTEQNFPRTRERLRDEIPAKLRKQGHLTDRETTQKQANASAEAAAGKALDKSGARQRAEATAQEKAEAKGEKAEAKGEAAAFDAEAQRVFAGFEAEAKRIEEAFGKTALETIKQRIEASPMADPEAIARQVAGQFAASARMQRATPGAANLAAQQVARRAGFDLGLPEIQTAAQLWLPRVRPRPGKRPMPKPKTKPAPTPVSTPKPKPKPRPTPPPSPGKPQVNVEQQRRIEAARKAVAENQKRAEERQKKILRAGQGLPAEAGERRAANQPAPAGAIDQVIDQVAQAQDQVAGVQSAVARVENRLAELTARNAKLGRNNRSLISWADTNQPSALNSGGGAWT
jgi:hypothetical protein